MIHFIGFFFEIQHLTDQYRSCMITTMKMVFVVAPLTRTFKSWTMRMRKVGLGVSTMSHTLFFSGGCLFRLLASLFAFSEHHSISFTKACINFSDDTGA